MNALALTVEQVEAKLLAMPQPRIDVIHRFEPGHYIREMRAPKNTLVVGAHHNFHMLNVFVKGAGNFRNNDGEIRELHAPMTFVSAPGRKAVYVTEDLVWQNIWATNVKDIDVLDKYLFRETEHAKQVAFSKYAAAWERHEEDRDDYAKMLEDICMTAERVDELTRNEEDQIALPYGEYKFRISVSPIHGVGTMATADIEEGEVIGIARVGILRTPLGRYMNHSVSPNATGRIVGGNIEVVATRRIRGDGSILCDGDEITVDYRESVALGGRS